MSENAWIEWKGRELPIHPNADVTVRFKHGKVFREHTGMARNFGWPRVHSYRLSGPSA